jgi:hypothetical protein
MFLAAYYGHVGVVAELIVGKASPDLARQVLSDGTLLVSLGTNWDYF